MAHIQEQRRGALAAAISAGILGKGDESATAMFMDLDLLHATIATLKRAPFPPSTLHTFAVKANPVGRVLELMRDAGMGAEVASLGELRQALACGFPPDRVVFDSPIKTREELRFALSAGVRLNLDNLQEVQRVAELLAAEPELLGSTAGDCSTAGPRLIGLRVNPQVGEGRIAALSTAGRVSKFGIPLLDSRGELLAAFANHPWINALHLHVGSQALPLELTVEGVARVADLMAEVEAAAAAAAYGSGAGSGRCRRIMALDIGGGLPVQYGDDDLGWLLGSVPADSATAVLPMPTPMPTPTPTPTLMPTLMTETTETEAVISIFERYANLLRQRLPYIFVGCDDNRNIETAVAATTTNNDNNFISSTTLTTATTNTLTIAPQLVTEFGRCLVAKSVFAAGRVEYSKHCGGRRVVVSGLGGDLLLRAVYLPDTWPVRVELYDSVGQTKVCGTTGSAAGGGEAADFDESSGPGSLFPTDVVGPLCFQGDRLAEAVLLPPAHPGDWIVVPDVGAYCLSMYSRYNSRCSPPVWGFRRQRRLETRPEDETSTAAGVTPAVATAVASAVAAKTKTPPPPPPVEEHPLPAAWAAGSSSSRVRVVAACGADHDFVLLRRGETVEEVMAFWNLV
ncbi:hypothetical protein VaNZ11_012721 [Volvox africanus]|uniref:Diaminopimelate decarboxylase n=1 Tax=Volvox africanus TaxID=51714 RepID=A0ABQ5SEK9_9CHLO|nr:hypothetical protein VaNZ11_012721 [Volvox africanus]